MLQMVMRSFIDMRVTVDPAYSIACPIAPPIPIRAMTARMMSFAVTLKPSGPSMVMRSV
jgi:hypothetical protein